MGAKGDEARERTTGAGTKVEQQVFSNSFEPSETTDNGFSLNQMIKVRKDSKSTIYLQNSKGDNIVNPIRNFFLQSIQGRFADRAQIMETYGGLDITVMGQKAVQLNISAILYNTESHNWRDQWIWYWDNYLRATQVAKRKAQTILTSDNLIARGVFLSYDFQETGDQQNSVGVSISMICPPQGIFPVKMQKGATYKITKNLTGVASDVLKSLENGTSNQYFANKTGDAPVFEGASTLSSSGTVTK
jgi:hypothetical protein